MHRNASTYIYLAVALGLICYITFIDKKIPGTKEREEAENELFKFDPSQVVQLEISNVHGFFFFQKDNNHWEIKKPVETLADGATVDGIIAQIAYAQPTQMISADKATDDFLKEWGLSPNPAERVVIHTKDKAYELLVGRKTAINDNVYARASGRKNEPVRILPNAVKQALQKDLSDFRSRNVFDFDLGKVTQVSSRIAGTTTTPGQQCEAILKDGKWTLQMPLVARAAEADVQALLNKILALRAVDFVSDDASNLSSYGLTSPSETLSVMIKPDASKPEEELELQIGGAVPGKPDQVYAQRLKSNAVFTLTKSGVDELLKALPNVRDKHVLPFDPAMPTGLSYTFGAKKGEIHRDHNLWGTVGDAKGSADVGKITDILDKLCQLQTTPVLKDSATDLKPYGLDKPLGKIVVQSPEFKPGPSVTLLIGKTENKLIYVRNSAEPFIYTIPDNALDMLPANNLELRDARVLNLDLKNVKGMTVTVGTAAPVALTRSSGGTWTPANVKDRMVNSLKAEQQSSLICQLQAKTWLGPVLPAYGLAKPALTFSIETDKSAPTVLHIGAALPDGGRAAQIEGDSTVFELSDPDYGILSISSLQPIPTALPSAQGTNAAPVAPAKK